MQTLFTSNKGCGSCNKLKPSDVLDPTLIPKTSIYQNAITNPRSSLTSSTTTTTISDEDLTSTTVSEADTHNKIPKPSTKLMNSIAVEKDSDDPHEDFRNSMLQMILEKEIYSETDLQELLECFLQLNAACHHHIIVQAFVEICEETFPKKLNGDDREVSRRSM